MSARRDPATGDFVRDANGKIIRAKRFYKCRVCGVRHDPNVPTLDCVRKAAREPENKPAAPVETPKPTIYRPGTLRYTAQDGEIKIAGPGSPLYLTLSIVAQEIWDERSNGFTSFNGDY